MLLSRARYTERENCANNVAVSINHESNTRKNIAIKAQMMTLISISYIYIRIRASLQTINTHLKWYSTIQKMKKKKKKEKEIHLLCGFYEENKKIREKEKWIRSEQVIISLENFSNEII